nr:hypothetical protein [Tanacetum cinerariifolium]
MGDENPISTLRDYSRPNHEGYRNIIELPNESAFAIRHHLVGAKRMLIPRTSNRNSSSLKRIHFINIIIIISKEDEPKEEEIIKPNALKVIEEAKSWDVGRGNLGDRVCRDTEEVEEAGEWMKYGEPLDLVDMCDEASDLENGFYLNMDKLDPSYKEETDRINLDGSFEIVSSPFEEYLDIGSPEVNGPLSPDYVPGPEESEQAPFVGNKMHKAFPLPRESSHWKYKFPLPVKHYALWEVIEFGDSYKVPKNSDLVDSRTKDGRTVTVTTDDMQKKKNDVKARTTLLLSLPDEHQLRFSKYKTARELWAAIVKTFGVIEFGDSYKVPKNSDLVDSRTKDGRTVTVTTDDMQKKKNDVKARTTLLLSLPDEHQLRFSKYKTARELWAAIVKTFGGNEATKRRKKNLLKQHYGNFKAEGTETLEQTFNRLQVIVSQLQFMDVEIKKDDLNQKFLTSLALEWLMHTIVWRNRNDLDSMCLDDLYNHLKVYEAEVQKKPNLNSQDMTFISSSKNNNNEDGNTVCVTTATTAFPTGSVNVATISQDTASAFIASQSNGSQIKFEEINQINEDDMEEMDIKWNMALLSMRDGIGATWKMKKIMLYRPSPAVVSTSVEDQNKDTSTSEVVASPNPPKPFIKPAGHRPHGPSMNPWRPTLNGARPYKSFFHAPSYKTRPFLKSSAVKNPYRAPWVPTV